MYFNINVKGLFIVNFNNCYFKDNGIRKLVQFVIKMMYCYQFMNKNGLNVWFKKKNNENC